MDSCAHCHLPLSGTALTDPASGLVLHPACAVSRLPQDALVAVGGALLLALAPVVLLWAG
jgi:hypothetical protein